MYSLTCRAMFDSILSIKLFYRSLYDTVQNDLDHQLRAYITSLNQHIINK